MDTTPKYILMSEKALEDLAEFQPHIQHEEIPHGANVVEIDYNGNWWFNRDNKILIPLFRQDQLQQMVIPPRPDETLLDYFYKWASDTFNPFVLHRETITWEQLWLGFVMNEKFKKVWNGKDWRKK